MYNVHITSVPEECLRKIEIEIPIEVVLLNGNIASDRATLLVTKARRVDSKIKIVVLVEDELDKARVRGYGADENAAKPICSCYLSFSHAI